MNKIRVTIVLGSPISNCAKYGVCSIEEEKNPELWESFTPAHHRHVKALLYPGPSGALCLYFPKNAMHPITPGIFFSGAGFLIESAKPLPYSISEQLGLPAETSFSPGIWPIAEDLEGFEVAIALADHVSYRLNSSTKGAFLGI